MAFIFLKRSLKHELYKYIDRLSLYRGGTRMEKALEAFWRNELSEEDFEEKLKKIRLSRINKRCNLESIW